MIKFYNTHKKALMKIMILLIFIIAVTGSCSYLNQKFGLSDDHVVEEIIEHNIEKHTGLDLDLSPESKE